MEMMGKHNSILGGENSGHIICLDKTTTGDGIIAALQVMAEMKYSDKCLHDLKQGMSKYPQILLNVKTSKKINTDDNAAIKAAVQRVENQLGSDGRVLLRASGTEPLIRVMVEGKDKNIVEAYAQSLVDTVVNSIDA